MSPPRLTAQDAAIRQLAPVVGPRYASAGVRFHDRRDNNASMSVLGLGVVLVGAVIAPWWTTGVQVELAALRVRRRS
jgi:hypothetical protein